MARDENITTLDITAKSGIKAFAPTMQNVMLYKDGKMSEAQYTDAYNRKMRDSLSEHPGEWEILMKYNRVAVMCYCRAGHYCHRHLFIPHMKNYLEHQGYEVVLHGELGFKEPPPAITSIPFPKPKVIPFFRKWDLLSNWAPRGFTVKGVHFKHVEQFMMYCKAKYMNDDKTAAEILAEDDPFECKKLGRKVKPYDDALWKLKRRGVVKVACRQKAKEHEDVRTYLLSTGRDILAEANPNDRLWGTGVGKDDPRISDPDQWEGENLLGEIWMELRFEFSNDLLF